LVVMAGVTVDRAVIAGRGAVRVMAMVVPVAQGATGAEA